MKVTNAGYKIELSVDEYEAVYEALCFYVLEHSVEESAQNTTSATIRTLQREFNGYLITKQ